MRFTINLPSANQLNPNPPMVTMDGSLHSPPAEEKPAQEETNSIDIFMDALDEIFDDYASEPVKPRKKRTSRD